MTISKMIESLTALRDAVGGDTEIPIVTTEGENDYVVADYPVVGEFEDQNGRKFKCAFLGSLKGEEFTRTGVPHYKWNPSEDEFKYDVPVRFDGYVHIDEMEMKKFPKPTIVDVSDSILRVTMHNPYIEDATVNGYEDNPTSPEIPGYDKNSDSIMWNIDIDSGTVMNWVIGTTARVHYKIVDEFEYEYDGFHYGPDYVPDFMGIDDDSFGDYVCLTIDGNGKIRNWNTKKTLKEIEDERKDS